MLTFKNVLVCHNTDGLVQERRNPIANALELSLSCTKPIDTRKMIPDWLTDTHGSTRYPRALSPLRDLLYASFNANIAYIYM